MPRVPHLSCIPCRLLDEWPALQRWQSPRNFSVRYGHHRVLAKRTVFGIRRAQEHHASLQHASVSLAEIIQRTHSEHVIVLDEFMKSVSEEVRTRNLHAREYSQPSLSCSRASALPPPRPT